MWIARAAEEPLTEWLESERRLIVVHGLGGSGSSSLVARALARIGARTVPRLDLSDVRGVSDVRARLRAIRGRPPRIWIDQVHRPRDARDAIASLLARTDARFVVAARAPLDVDDEHCVPVPPLDRDATRALLVAELARLGLVVRDELDAVAAQLDGWPLAVLGVALAARTMGLEPMRRGTLHVHELDRRCAAVLEDGWRTMEAGARALAAALARAPVSFDAARVGAIVPGGRAALAGLVASGLVVVEPDGVRVLAPVASFARSRSLSPSARRACEALSRHVLAEAEQAAARHRRTPVACVAVLERLSPALFALAEGREPRSAVRAALALEPILFGRLERRIVLGHWARAHDAARALGPAMRAEVEIARARTWIARGDHESAETALRALPRVARASIAAIYRDLYLAHIAAWRGELGAAGALLDEVERRLASRASGKHEERSEDAREDLALQRLFLAFQRGDLDGTERLARALAARAAARPSPRMVALARRFTAEVKASRGAPREAVPLLRETRAELARCGDSAGALFTWSREIAALRAAGDDARAEEDARAVALAAARSDEAALELAVVSHLAADGATAARVAELAWRAQIPGVRGEAERFLATVAPARPAAVLHLDGPTKHASITGRAASFSRRPTLWRMLRALAEAHARRAVLSSGALFAAGWPGERAEPVSQRKRVQTAIWTLRRALLGPALETRSSGYALRDALAIRDATT